ncbi:transporter substrate-binding domain-containing protein [Chitinibacter bivalviorum]|uniref:Transporter substrate-binding domain-containing protein n=1 Tax=Chitinibacter bivalviorum TaxID=2739434 RepID=A0A7H9BF99_9NEIS|nr:transporter substrate-binding domain-containing protein [Chitinibacter bivalviorum]QLG87247.1 transporter substrate-binding domain-containing protein [Chitinibacter bivalviorum]
MPYWCKQTLASLIFLISNIVLATKVQAQGLPLRVLLSDSNEMPLAQFENGQLKAGFLFDLGNMLAQQLNRSAVFIALPRKRLSPILESGQVDIICNQNPRWLPGPFDWSTPFIPHAELIVSDQRFTRPKQLNDLANIRIGTILGFNYAEVQQALGTQFIRDDTLTVHSNLRKLAAGYVHHIIIDQYVLEYQQKMGEVKVALHPYLLIKNEKASCGISRNGQVSAAQVNQAINELLANQKLPKLFNKYH